MSGSGLFTNQAPAIPHLSKGETADLRADVARVLLPMAALTVEEYTNPAAAAAAGLKAATASSIAVQTVLTAGLLAPGIAALLAYGRNVTFTTAGATPADAPANAVVTGTGMNDEVVTETITVAQTATISSGSKIFKTITSIVFGAGEGVAATVAIGFGLAMGTLKTPKVRAGMAALVREIAIGALVTTGTLDAANKSYTPASAQDGAKDYAIFYEYNPLV